MTPNESFTSIVTVKYSAAILFCSFFRTDLFHMSSVGSPISIRGGRRIFVSGHQEQPMSQGFKDILRVNDCFLCRKPQSSDCKILPCSHSFHSNCIDKWKSNTPCSRCPICQSYLEDADNLLDSAVIHLPSFDSCFLQPQVNQTASLIPPSAKAKGLALLFLLAQATDELEDSD